MQSKAAKKKSTLLKDAIALFLITLISGLALSSVNEITKAPIEQQRKEKAEKAYSVLFADGQFEELDGAVDDARLDEIDDAFSKVSIDKVVRASDSSGNILGYIVEITTKEGYKPPMTLTIGYTTDQRLTGIVYIKFSENKNVGEIQGTFTEQFIGATADRFSFEGNDGVRVDAVSGSTMSSKAILHAVNAGIAFINENMQSLGGWEVENK